MHLLILSVYVLNLFVWCQIKRKKTAESKMKLTQVSEKPLDPDSAPELVRESSFIAPHLLEIFVQV